MRAAWRLFTLQLATLLGARRGFFIPYRYAAQVRPAAVYGALLPLFAAAEPAFLALLAGAAAHRDVFQRMGGAPPAPRFTQDWFPRLDAIAAYTLVRARAPHRIVEIGSGHSTRFLARAIADGNLAARLTAIDPQPRAALAGLTVDWLPRTLQDAGPAPFAALGAGDMLFIDSSHILASGSDVDLALNELLPRLPAGVLVHIHDIFLPDGYPDSWTWRGYNEQNAVAPLLSGGAWRMLWSSRYVATRMRAELEQSGLADLPLNDDAFESSLWLEKKA